MTTAEGERPTFVASFAFNKKPFQVCGCGWLVCGWCVDGSTGCFDFIPSDVMGPPTKPKPKRKRTNRTKRNTKTRKHTRTKAPSTPCRSSAPSWPPSCAGSRPSAARYSSRVRDVVVGGPSVGHAAEPTIAPDRDPHDSQ